MGVGLHRRYCKLQSPPRLTRFSDLEFAALLLGFSASGAFFRINGCGTAGASPSPKLRRYSGKPSFRKERSFGRCSWAGRQLLPGECLA